MPKPQLKPEWIDPHALNIVNSLQGCNFTTYLVGGCVRDLLVGIRPKDFDIVTMAEPEDVQKIIRPSYIIGKRFRLVLAKRAGQQFEIATFRSLKFQNNDDPELVDENIYGEPKEDALRRDFTINGLFYDPVEEHIIDFTEGKADIDKRILRMIGDPVTRIEEDPIRILRALRLSHKISFSLELSLRQAIHSHSHLLQGAILPRVREEILKIIRLKEVEAALWECKDLGILKVLLPTLDTKLDDKEWATDFFVLLKQGLETVYDKQDSYELYTVFMYAFLGSENEQWQANLSTKFSEELNQFMRQELGMHRVETEMLSQSLNLVKQLVKSPLPEEVKPRHRAHLVNNRSLYLALTLAEAYHYLSQKEILQWLQAVKQRTPKKTQKKRPRRRK